MLDRLREPSVSVAPGTTEAAAAHLEVVFSQLALSPASNSPEAYREMDRLTAVLPGSAVSGGRAGDTNAA